MVNCEVWRGPVHCQGHVPPWAASPAPSWEWLAGQGLDPASPPDPHHPPRAGVSTCVLELASWPGVAPELPGAVQGVTGAGQGFHTGAGEGGKHEKPSPCSRG